MSILMDVLSNKDNIWLLLDISLIGGMIEVTNRSGIKESVTKLFKEISNKALATQILTMSLLLSFDDYFFPSLLSSVVRKEKTLYKNRNFVAFICRGSTISFANFNPISWPIYTMSLLVVNGVASKANCLSVYYKISLYMFFPIVLVGLFIIKYILLSDFADSRLEYLKSDSMDKYDLQCLLYMGIPIAFHMIFSIIEGDTLKPLIITTAITAFFHAFRKRYSFLEIPSIIISGIRNMMEICVIIVLSLVLSKSMDYLYFTQHSVSVISMIMPAKLFPVAIFTFFSLTEYVFSLNWTLWLITFPMIIQISSKTSANLFLCIGAVLSAGILGSISCIYSDSTVLCIKSYDLDIRNHSIVALKDVIPAAAISILLYFLFGVAT